MTEKTPNFKQRVADWQYRTMEMSASGGHLPSCRINYLNKLLRVLSKLEKSPKEIDNSAFKEYNMTTFIHDFENDPMSKLRKQGGKQNEKAVCSAAGSGHDALYRCMRARCWQQHHRRQ